MELHFSGVQACVESRPRGASHALRVSLGAVSLRDRVTRHTLFPIVCAPQVNTKHDYFNVLSQRPLVAIKTFHKSALKFIWRISMFIVIVKLTNIQATFCPKHLWLLPSVMMLNQGIDQLFSE